MAGGRQAEVHAGRARQIDQDVYLINSALCERAQCPLRSESDRIAAGQRNDAKCHLRTFGSLWDADLNSRPGLTTVLTYYCEGRLH